MSVRVRMAPSPTGFLHVGDVRTFLFNWLFARHHGGECLLRIENTDTSREVAEATDQIQESLRWLGLDWDGQVTFQLDRIGALPAGARRLVAEGKAYEDDGAIRFRMPDEGVTGWDDVVLGRIEVPNEELEDVVIVRSDGRPTYNFASPVEDVLDGITHVIRGHDHVSNTPKQINILRALGAELPMYAHVPNVLGTGREEALEAPRRGRRRRVPRRGLPPGGADQLPRAARLELRRQDDDHVARRARRALLARPRRSRARPTFDYEKLDWMNGVYLRALPPDEYADRLVEYLREQGYDWDEEIVRKTAPLVQEKIEKLGEYPDFAGFFFHDVEPERPVVDPARRACRRRGARAGRAVRGGADRGGAARARGAARPEAARRRSQPIRVAVTGSKVSPGALREPRAARTRASRSRGSVAAAAA